MVEQMNEAVEAILESYGLEADLSLQDEVDLRTMLKLAFAMGVKAETVRVREGIVPQLIDEAIGKGILIGRLQATTTVLGRVPKIREIGYRNQLAKSFGSFSRALEVAANAQVVVPPVQLISLTEEAAPVAEAKEAAHAA